MTILTRIKNNQITDNTIEYQKIKSGTLVGTNFNANLTLNSNVTILGNLTVANSFAQLNSINTYINDPVVVFNNNYTGSPTYDIGILVNRNLSALAPYGSVNAAFVWKEADTAFEALMTSETGTTAGAINNSGWANIKAGNTTIVSGNVTEAFNVVGASTFNTIEVTNLSTFNGNVVHTDTVYIVDTTASTTPGTGALVVDGGVGIGGNLNVYGNISTATGNIITTSAGIFYGNATTGFGAIYAGIPTGYNVLPQTVVQVSSDVDNYSQINFENINGGTDASTDYVATASEGGDTEHYINMGITGQNWDGTQENSLSNSLGGVDGYLYVQGNTSTLGGNLVVGASTAGARKVSIIVGGNTASNITAVFNNSGTVSTTSTNGALTVTGGAGISQNLNVGGTAKVTGNIVAASGIASTNTTSGALVVTGGAGVSGNLNIGSQLTVTGATALNSTLNVTGITTFGAAVINNGNIVAASGTTSTNTTTGALVVVGGAGVSGSLNIGDTTSIAGITSVTNSTQSTTSANGALVVTGGVGIAKNLNVGGDALVTGNLTVQGTMTAIQSTTLDVTDLNITVAKGAVSAAAANGAGITVDGASATLLYTSSTDSWNINKQLIGTGATLSNSTASTNTTTGALVVTGGVGIGGALNIGGTLAAGTASFASINNTPIGNATPSTGVFTTLQSTTAVTTNFSSGNILVTGGTANGLTTLSATTAQATNFSSGNILVTGGTANGLTTLSATTAVLTNFSTANAVISGGYITGVANVYATTGVTTNFSTANAVIAGGSVNGTPIGASTASTGRFTTVTATGVTTIGGNLVANSGTNSTSTTTGAAVVTGGLGVMANVHVGGASTFNSNQTSGYDTIIKGANDATLIWAHPNTTYDTVVIGNSAVVGDLVVGAKLIFNTTDSIIVPVGGSAQRPSNAGGTDTLGMFRYNTTLTALEIYDGAEWDQLTTQFTVITDEQFSGDDVTTGFTLGGTSTSAATVVSINGVIQIPTLAYSVSGTTLTFTEAPATGDLIDVRRLATTSVVSGIASTNGYNQVQTDNDGAFIYTGSTGTSPTTQWNTEGAEVNLKANVLVVVDNGDYVVDSFSATAYSSAEYTVTSVIKNTGIREIAKILAVHDGATASITEFGVVSTAGNVLVNYSANIVSGNLKLYANTTNANTIIRLDSVYQAI